MPDLHPLIVHFPVALLTFAAGADLVGLSRRNARATLVGWWSQIVGTAGILLGVASGLLARGRILEVEQLARLENHEQLAFLVAAAYAGLALWRAGARGRVPSRFYVVCLCAALLLLWSTAWFGGELVYRFGIGVMR